jgi:hypothetical protein
LGRRGCWFWIGLGREWCRHGKQDGGWQSETKSAKRSRRSKDWH